MNHLKSKHCCSLRKGNSRRSFLLRADQYQRNEVYSNTHTGIFSYFSCVAFQDVTKFTRELNQQHRKEDKNNKQLNLNNLKQVISSDLSHDFCKNQKQKKIEEQRQLMCLCVCAMCRISSVCAGVFLQVCVEERGGGLGGCSSSFLLLSITQLISDEEFLSYKTL